MSDKEVTCPYCNEDFDVNTDDGAHYNDGESESEYCPNCDKQVMIYSSCSWYREASKADCLNGISDHDWSDWTTHHPNKDFTKWYATRHCQTCDERGNTWLDIANDPDEQRKLQIYKDIEARHETTK